MIDYKENYKKINDIVENYFSLNDKSLDVFKEKMSLGFASDDDIKSKLNSDYRLEIKLDHPFLEEFDESWALFKYFFGEFCVDEKITYQDFFYNINSNNSGLRLSKSIMKYYFSKETFLNLMNPGMMEEYINCNLNKVNANRLPKEKIKLVLTFNLSDMFLCSTGQSWTSCLNLESEYSGCYWYGLASLPFDKNRGMLYLSSAKENIKESFEIKGERIYRRSFVLIDKDGTLNILKWYPNDYNINNYIKPLNKLFSDFNFKVINSSFKGKHSITLPSIETNRGEREFYIYQDKTLLTLENEDQFNIKYCNEKGHQSFIQKEEEYGPFIKKEGGLISMMNHKEKVGYFVNSFLCDKCEIRFFTEPNYYEDCFYCDECYEEI